MERITSAVGLRGAHRIDRWIVVVGGLLAIMGVADVFNDPWVPLESGIELLIALSIPAAFVVVGYRLTSTDLDSVDTTRLLFWWLLGMTVVTAVVAGVLLHELLVGDRVVNPFLMLASGASIGAIAGISVGTHELEHRYGPSSPSERQSEPASGLTTRLTTGAASEATAHQRRLVIRYLADVDASAIRLEELASWLATQGPTTSDQQTVAARLHHADLPALSALGALTYDPQRKLIIDFEVTSQLYEK